MGPGSSANGVRGRAREVGLLALALTTVSCVAADRAPNRLTAVERAAGWTLLFDGETLEGWRGLGRDTVPSAHWVVEGGAIRKIPSGQVPVQADGQPLAGGDLMTVDADGTIESHRAGGLYDLIVPNSAKRLRPVGEWNESRIVFRGAHGEHWLNGEKIVEYDLGSARVDSLIAASKYRIFPWFGERRTGHIVLQDHGDEVWFRNLKLRELE